MNGRRPSMMMMQPDRRPQELARVLAMQERNSSLDGTTPRQAPQPSLAYAGATPNSAPGVAPQNMNFNGPQGPQQYRGPISNPAMSAMAPPQQGGAAMGMPRAPQLGGMQRQRMPSPAGMTTPQGGRYRGDFDGE
jgi:hypothetical protein